MEVYFAAVGGAGAILSKAIKKSEVIAYDDLGTEETNKKVICRRLSCNSCNRQPGKQPIRNSNKRICKTVK